MVASINGVASIGGRASGIGGTADRRAMRALRSAADAVMVGAGTLRAEKMRLDLDGQSQHQPLAVVLCGSQPPPLSKNLLRDPGVPQQLLLIIPSIASQAYASEGSHTTGVLTVPSNEEGRVDLGEALRLLRERFGVSRLLVEGGAGVNGALLRGGFVDELFVTVAPTLLANDGVGIADITGRSEHDLGLISVRSIGDEVFTRYALKREPARP